MTSFICQLSEMDWLVSREIGVYGNREGSEKEGEVVYFKTSKKGDQIIQSIIEDLVGMRKGNNVFFHVIKTKKGESSIHGVYKIREEPFYNSNKKFWESNPQLVYPYRFCFEPHPEHIELCKYDANIKVSELYRAIERRQIRSILTLEREARGAAHAVKTITDEDAMEIIKMLYKNFRYSIEKPIQFKPTKMGMKPLRNRIKRIGAIEFAIKALLTYQIANKNPELIQYLPACRNGECDCLIESFIGQTMRRPTDILCMKSEGSKREVTILEGKTDTAKMDDLIQSLKYQEMFKLRNSDRSNLQYKISICLLAQRFQKNLIKYTSIRNIVLPWEEVILLKYTPTQDGTDAKFSLQQSTKPSIASTFTTYPEIKTHQVESQIISNPNNIYQILGRKTPSKITIEIESIKKDVIVLQKYYSTKEKKTLLGHILINLIPRKVVLEDLVEVMNKICNEANKFQGDFMAVEPVIIAENYDTTTKFFIDKYNEYEVCARRQPISVYILPKDNEIKISLE